MKNTTVAHGAAPPGRVSGYVPVRTPDTGALPNPDSAFAHAAALRAVTLYLLADSFDLRPEEVTWAGRALDDVCGELLTHTAHSIPFPARQEMLNGTYTRLLELRSHVSRSPLRASIDRNVISASRREWVDALLAPFTSSYALPPMTESRLRAKFERLLADIGVGDPGNPRPATYLPTELRQRVIADRNS